MTLFEKLGLNEEVLRGIEELGFQSPTPIQEKVINHILTQPGDVIALAQTGTGKTAAFGLPVIQQVDTTEKNIQALVLAPTRELCVQIASELNNYSKFIKGIKIVPVYGGESIEKQIRQLEKTPQILVATPGRLTDFIKRKRVDLSGIKWLVLDEADEMLDMGFEEDIRYIIGKTPEDRRTLLFSATMSSEVRDVAESYLSETVEISAGKVNSGTGNVTHHYYLIEGKHRYNALKRLADLYPEIYGIVFCRTRKETQEVSDSLTRDGYNADALHGDLSQAQRDAVMKKFRDKSLNLLVATDVAARGLDVNNLTHVINYNLPDDVETYTHRSGRTGRANNVGISIALVTRSEREKIYRIEKKLQRKFEIQKMPDASVVLQKQIHNFIDKVEKIEVNHDQIAPLVEEIHRKLDWMDKDQLINHFISYEVERFLKYYQNAPDLNVSERPEKRERGDRSDRRDRGERGGRDKGNRVKLEINLGLKHGLNPARLLGIINETSGDSGLKVGRIDIQNKYTIFEVDPKDSDNLIKVFGKKYKGENLVVQMASAHSGNSGRKERSTGGRRR